MTQSVEYRVTKVVAKIKNISPSEILPQQSIEDFCDSSIDLVSLLFDLEEEFSISIPDEARELETIQEIIDGIKRLLEGRQILEEV